MKIIVTGGAGFIGANFLNRLVPELPEHQFINLDKLTYAANLGSLRGIEALPNYDAAPGRHHRHGRRRCGVR